MLDFIHDDLPDAADQVELEGVLSDIRHHTRKARALQAKFDAGTTKDPYDAAELQGHRLAIKGLRSRLPKPRLVSSQELDLLDHPKRTRRAA